MKQRFSSHTTLIELTLALFFLMLAMVTIIGLYTTAYGMSDEAQRMTYAVQCAQDCTALIEGGADPLAALAENGFHVEADGARLELDRENMSVHVALNQEQTQAGMLYRGTIGIEHQGENLLVWPVAHYIRK